MDRITFCRQFVFFDHIFLMIFGEKWWCPWIAVFSSGCIAHYFESRSRLLTLHSPELWTYITLVSFINQIATIANSSFRLVPFFPRLPSLLRDTWQLYTPSLFTGAPNISLKTNRQINKIGFQLIELSSRTWTCSRLFCLQWHQLFWIRITLKEATFGVTYSFLWILLLQRYHL